MTSAIAVAQFAPGIDRAANLADIRALTTEARDRGAGLVVFPEYSAWFEQEMGEEWRRQAEALDGPFPTALAAIAIETGVTLVAGFLERAGDDIHNTVVAIGPDGARLATYRKLHLYDAFGGTESDWLTAGAIEPPEVFAWEGFTVGLQTCYDLRFPEVSRRLVDAGADLLLVPSEWVRGPMKEHHWRTLLTARAIENTVYVAAADHTPPIGVGQSLILDPAGVEVATVGDVRGVAIAWPDPLRTGEVRTTNPALRLRRFAVVPLQLGDSDRVGEGTE